jgi:hypothetical protein
MKHHRLYGMEYCDYEHLIVAIHFLQQSVTACEDLEGMFLNNGYWVASVAVNMACIALGKCFTSAHHQLLFITTLCESSFTEHLPGNLLFSPSGVTGVSWTGGLCGPMTWRAMLVGV